MDREKARKSRNKNNKTGKKTCREMAKMATQEDRPGLRSVSERLRESQTE